MSSKKFGKPGKPLQKLSQTIETLDSLFFRLYSVMEEQVEAVIASDTKTVEKLTEEYTMLQKEYKTTERDFIKELENCLSLTNSEDQAVKLESLKKMYPSEVSWIDLVKKTFTDHTSQLVTKQRQLIDLLEFALIQNSKMMLSIYNTHSAKHIHYSQKGRTNGIQSGVAVNQEV